MAQSLPRGRAGFGRVRSGRGQDAAALLREERLGARRVGVGPLARPGSPRPRGEL